MYTTPLPPRHSLVIKSFLETIETVLRFPPRFHTYHVELGARDRQ